MQGGIPVPGDGGAQADAFLDALVSAHRRERERVGFLGVLPVRHILTGIRRTLKLDWGGPPSPLPPDLQESWLRMRGFFLQAFPEADPLALAWFCDIPGRCRVLDRVEHQHGMPDWLRLNLWQLLQVWYPCVPRRVPPTALREWWRNTCATRPPSMAGHEQEWYALPALVEVLA